MMNFKNFIFFYIFLITANLSFAQKVSQDEIYTTAENFLKNSGNSDLLNNIPVIHRIYSDKSGKLLFYVCNYPNAFIVISANKNNYPIKAFSFKHKLNLKRSAGEIHFIDILKSDYEQFNKLIKNNPDWAETNRKKWENVLLNVRNKNITDETYGPYLSSLYGQVNCHDNNGKLVNVTNYYTPNHYAVGCVAMVFAEVMRYYGWPRKGVGSFSYTDNYGSSTGTYNADFEEKYYNWDIIPDEFDGVSSTDKQRSELGRVTFQAAVSVKMDFENGGSTSNINRIPSAASKYFRYIADYKEKTASDFWQILDTSLHHGIPAQFAVYTDGGAGHAVVGDGIKYTGGEKYYHLNMGWWGDDNGWYQIHQSFNAGGYTNVTAAVLNMLPVPELDDSPEIDTENKTVKLKWYYSEKLQAEKYELQIKTGPADWETLTDTITQKSFVFQADNENEYTFRLRAKIGGNWTENAWSNEIKIIPADFKAQGKETLTVFPASTNNIIKISYKNLSGNTLKIYNLQGALIFQNSEIISNNEVSLDVSNFETGLYIVQIIGENENITAKFFKE